MVGGAIAGGLLGLGVGAAVANKKAVLQQEDSNIDAAINSALAANRQARNRVAGLTAELNALKRRAARAKSAGNAREIQKIKAEATALRTKFEKSDAEVEACIERSGSLAKQMGQKHSKYAAMKSGVAELQQTRSEASNGKKEIASLLSTL